MALLKDAISNQKVVAHRIIHFITINYTFS